jgi:toluene monooxygenase system protein D
MKNPVGPVLRIGDDVDQIISALEDDNPTADIEVIDKGAYIRVQAEDFLELREETLQDYLGPEYRIRSLEVTMSSFAGRVLTGSDSVRWQRADLPKDADEARAVLNIPSGSSEGAPS